MKSAVIKKLEALFPGRITAKKKPWTSFTEVQAHTGDLEMINGLIGEFTDQRKLPNFTPCAENFTPPKAHTMATFDTNCNHQLRALVFRDSFFSNLQPFLSEYLGLSRYIWQHMTLRATKKNTAEIMPHIVIEEWVDRHLPKLKSPD